MHKQALRLDITRRVAQEIVCAVVDRNNAMSVAVLPHALHGLEIVARVPSEAAMAVRDKLARLPIRYRVETFEEDNS